MPSRAVQRHASALREKQKSGAESQSLDYPCVVARSESRPGSEPATPPTLVVVPLWYRLLRPLRPDCPQPGTLGTRGTLRDTSTLDDARLGAERSPVQIRPPRLAEACSGSGLSASRGPVEHGLTGAVVPAVVPSEVFALIPRSNRSFAVCTLTRTKALLNPVDQPVNARSCDGRGGRSSAGRNDRPGGPVARPLRRARAPGGGSADERRCRAPRPHGVGHARRDDPHRGPARLDRARRGGSAAGRDSGEFFDFIEAHRIQLAYAHDPNFAGRWPPTAQCRSGW